MRQATSKTEVSHRTVRDILNSFRHLTAAEVSKKLGLSRFQLDIRIERGIFPKPTYVRKSGARFFDENWVRIAQAILDSSPNTEGRRNAQANQERAKIVPKPRIELCAIAVVCELDYEDKELLPDWLKQKVEENERNEQAADSAA